MVKIIFALTYSLLICFSTTTYAANDAALKSCQSKLRKAQSLDLLVDINVKSGYFNVVVGPTFYKIQFDSKEGFAETLNCVFNMGESGPKSLCNEIRFVNWRTGNEDARYSWCKLKVKE